MIKTNLSGGKWRPALASELAADIGYNASCSLVALALSILKMFTHRFPCGLWAKHKLEQL